MALINCSECGKEISDKAASCPGCGCPVNIKNDNMLATETNSSASISPNKKNKYINMYSKKTIICALIFFAIIATATYFIIQISSISSIKKESISAKVNTLINYSISASSDTSYVTDSNNNVWIFGDGFSSKPELLDHNGSFNKMYLNYYKDWYEARLCFLLRSDGTVKGFGSNICNQLSPDSLKSAKEPIDIIGLSDIISMSLGENHTLALKRDGTVWSWGCNNNYQLGDDTGGMSINNNMVRTSKLPQRVPGIVKAKEIGAGRYFSFVLTENGDVYYLYNKTTKFDKNVKHIASSLGQLLVLKYDGTVWKWSYRGYEEVTGLSRITSIASGHNFSLALKEDGSVWAWGENKHGQLGDGTITYKIHPTRVKEINNVVSIAAGANHSLALTKDNSIYSWGENTHGQLGDGMNNNRIEPFKISF